MGKGLAITLGVLLVLGISGVSCGGWVIGTRNEFVQQEQGIKAQYDQNRNNYDNFVKSVIETAGVAGKYADDLAKVTRAAIEGRYGANGSQAVFQWIQEQNPQVDASIYKKIQQVIEAGRLSFETNQKTLIDKKRVYETMLNQFPGNLVAGMMGFPKIDLDKYGIVTSDRTEKAFETKKDEAIKIQ